MNQKFIIYHQQPDGSVSYPFEEVTCVAPYKLKSKVLQYIKDGCEVRVFGSEYTLELMAVEEIRE